MYDRLSEFHTKFSKLLGEQFHDFLESLQQPRVSGLRVNTTKISVNRFLSLHSFSLTAIPWCANGFYVEDSTQRPGKHPYHEAGLYYLQDPSAMLPAELLSAQPGDHVLDLCAAPGGKSTQIASQIGNDGFLLANEIHPARARQLSQNIERLGFANTVVSNETPERLSQRFPSYFDKILVDAPCSGEGMFRKNEDAIQHWSQENVLYCHERQLSILLQAAKMLKKGGRLVYSTCTFSPEEDEQTIVDFLSYCPEFEIEQIHSSLFDSGHPEWASPQLDCISGTCRLWPHRQRGEGHYVAVLHKSRCTDSENIKKQSLQKVTKKAPLVFQSFAKEVFAQLELENFFQFGDQLYCAPQGMPSIDGLKVIRPGLHLGSIAKKHFLPSHALSHFVEPAQVVHAYHLNANQKEVEAYLQGHSLPYQAAKGWFLVCVDGFPLGWGKASDGQIKNHFPKGLRWC